jgi:LAS superfamily LD-carboxypeptidase LdcB
MVHAQTRSTFRRRAAGALAIVIAVAVTITACAAVIRAGAPPTPTPHADRSTTGLISADGDSADGDSVSPFDKQDPAVTNLDPALRDAVRQAASDASADGVEIVITSGWRSERYQQALLDQAIVTYGSEAEARKWVNTPAKSAHVTGHAVDVGPTDADSWLSQHGGAYGLCQTYANEMWHFELMVAPGGTCPSPIQDASAG